MTSGIEAKKWRSESLNKQIVPRAAAFRPTIVEEEKKQSSFENSVESTHVIGGP